MPNAAVQRLRLVVPRGQVSVPSNSDYDKTNLLIFGTPKCAALSKIYTWKLILMKLHGRELEVPPHPLSRLWHWWAGALDRLPDRWFAPEPKPILSDQEKAYQQELSKAIKRVFYTLIGSSLFCVVTVAGSPDIRLLTQESTVKLPVLNYDMGFEVFLLVGPIVLIALTIYLHVFVAQHRRLEVDLDGSQPMLSNFSGRTPRLAAYFIYYWMVPVTLAVFTWKASPWSVGPYLGYVTLGIALASVLLQFRRCPRACRACALPLLALASFLVYLGVDKIKAPRVLSLSTADLSGKDLRPVNLYKADLSGANLTQANLSKANLSDANLSKADLSEAKLSGADLFRANLSEANLSGAKLVKADLTAANLSNADLTAADLSGADLTATNLPNADLTAADLFGANVDQDVLEQACGDKATRLPKGLEIKDCPSDQGDVEAQESIERRPLAKE